MAFTLLNHAPIGSLLKGDKKPRKQARSVKDSSHRKFVSGLPCCGWITKDCAITREGLVELAKRERAGNVA